jgi:hypothetical protein
MKVDDVHGFWWNTVKKSFMHFHKDSFDVSGLCKQIFGVISVPIYRFK